MTDLLVTDVRIPMRDGTSLAADVIRRGDAGPLPVLLIRTPYSRGAMRLVHDVVGLARDGWVVVVQDVRGRFDSGGRFEPFEQEVDDGYDTVEWCAGRPWSDGRVAMTGWSYVGATQWLAALKGHPALLAINPIVAGGDIADAMLTEGGAFQIGLVQPWALGLAASDPAADDVHRQTAGRLGGEWPQTMRAAPGADPVAELLPSYRAWRRRDSVTAASVHGRYDEVDVAAFQIAGWYDVFCESALRHWQGLAASGRPQRLVIGPWSHSNGLSNLHPELDFGSAANGGYAGVTGQALHWLRQVLDGRRDVASGISCFVMHEGWRELDAWPPPAEVLTLHLGDGLLVAEPPSTAGEVSVRHDPHDPVPTRGGRVLGPFLPLPGPVDQRPLEDRSDVVVLTADACVEPLVVIGTVTASVRVTSTARSVDIALKLCDVFPDGRVFNVVDSVRRVDVVPGEWIDVDVELGSTAYRFRAGHRIRLHVAGSNFPRFDVNPGTGDPPGTATRFEAGVHRLCWGPGIDAGLRLPVDRTRVEPDVRA